MIKKENKEKKKWEKEKLKNNYLVQFHTPVIALGAHFQPFIFKDVEFNAETETSEIKIQNTNKVTTKNNFTHPFTIFFYFHIENRVYKCFFEWFRKKIKSLMQNNNYC